VAGDFRAVYSHNFHRQAGGAPRIESRSAGESGAIGGSDDAVGIVKLELVHGGLQRVVALHAAGAPDFQPL